MPRSSTRRCGAPLALLATLLAAGLLAACGQTGPLYLPEDEGATVITRPAGDAAPSTAPTPAPPASPATAPAPARRGAERVTR
jgi:predicted small lipoprotein YifL